MRSHLVRFHLQPRPGQPEGTTRRNRENILSHSNLRETRPGGEQNKQTREAKAVRTGVHNHPTVETSMDSNRTGIPDLLPFVLLIMTCIGGLNMDDPPICMENSSTDFTDFTDGGDLFIRAIRVIRGLDFRCPHRARVLRYGSSIAS